MKDKKSIKISGKFPPMMYGLKGIQELFSVGLTTAWRYRHGIISEACTQQGNKIVIDTRKALELFGVKEPEKMIKSVKK